MDSIINEAISRERSLFRDFDFRNLWIGQTISEIGSRVSREGIPLTAVLVLHASPAQMGVLTAIGAAAVLPVSLVAGLWVDRVRKRPVMIAADLARALLLATVPFAAMRNSLSMAQLYSVLACTGALTVLFDVAYQSFVPLLADRDRILEANSKLAASSSAAEIAGPGLTGFLVQAITAPLAILVDAISFLVSAVSAWLIRKPEPKPERHSQEEWWRETGAGLRFIAREPILRALAARSAAAYLFYGFIGPLYMLYGIRELRLSPAALGIIIAVGGAGSLIGSSLAPALAHRLGTGRTFMTASLVIGIATFFIPLASGPTAVRVTCLVISQLFGDAAFGVYHVNELSVRQLIAPENVLGRVNGAMQLVSLGIWPLAAMLGGILAEAAGVRMTLIFAAIGVSLSSLLLIFSPVRTLK